jgi:alcohol dehydrogenase
MSAIVYDTVGGPLRPTQVERPACPPGAVVVDVLATGVCRSDWHAWRGHENVPLPHVPGHEFAGTVARLGEGVRGISLGTRVTAPFVNGCGRCGWCAAGQAQVCPDQTQPGFTHPGSFAEQVVVRAAETNLVPLPDEVDLVSAAALGCRFATAFRALTGPGRLAEGEQVAVWGCGGVGLSAVLIAVALGARVVAVDRSAAALARAAELGAAVVVDAGATTDPAADVRAATGGGAHLSLDALGSAGTAAGSVRSLRRHGRHVQVGLMLGTDAQAPLPWEVLVPFELEVLGSHGMAAADYPRMLDLVASGRLRPRDLVGRVVGLAEAGAALAAMDDPVAATAGITVAALGPDPGPPPHPSV